MSFDRIAPFYHFLERVCAGNLMQRCRIAHLDRVGNAKNVLIVGEGTGRFLEMCFRGLPNAQITVVDASQAMLDKAKKRCGNAPGIRFLKVDLREWASNDGPYDLIVTHYFLDCFSPDDLPKIIQKLSASATSSAQWLLADFQEPPHGPARWRAQLILRAAYLFFRITADLQTIELTSPDSFLRENGFCLEKREIFDWGLMHSDLWSR